MFSKLFFSVSHLGFGGLVWFGLVLISVRECGATEKHLELYDLVQHLSLNNAVLCPRNG